MKANIKYITIFILLGLAVSGYSQSIEADVTQGCSPLTVSFSSSVSNAVTYYWDFGNGSNSAVAEPTILFTTAGSFNILLITTDAAGEGDTLSNPGFIKVDQKPSASFSSSASEICSSNSVGFTNNSSGAATYIWDFGNGDTSSEINPEYRYNEPGSYTVSLITYSEFDCSDIFISPTPIVVLVARDARFTADVTSACETNTYINFFPANTTASSYLWDFGDGETSADKSPTHLFVNFGSYDITLTVTDAGSCIGLAKETAYIQIVDITKANIIRSDSVIPNGGSVTFSVDSKVESVNWELSNGFTSSESSFSYTFADNGTYGYSANVVYKNGCSSMYENSSAVLVIDKPELALNFTSNQGCAPLTVQYMNTTPNIVTSSWKIEGANYTGENIWHTFESEGIYSLEVTTSLANGYVFTEILDSIATIRVPSLKIISTNYAGCAPVSFEFELVGDPVSTVLWSLSDGQSSSSLEFSGIINAPGNYTVSALATTTFGCTKEVVFENPIEILDIGIDYSEPEIINVCQSDDITFYGIKVGTGFWNWDFGDGTTSNLSNPVHVYAGPGTYEVSLETNNKFGCPVVIPKFSEVIVNSLDVAFSFDLIIDCSFSTLELQSDFDPSTTYVWNFGDGESTSDVNPSHVYYTPGIYSISLSGTSSTGCNSMRTVMILVPPTNCDILNIDPIFVPSDSSSQININTQYEPLVIEPMQFNVCSPPFELVFQNPKPLADEWTWDFGDGSVSTVENPTHVFSRSGAFSVTLNATTGGAVDTVGVFAQVTVGENNLDFTFSESTSCGITTVAFESRGSATSGWNWDYGDGNQGAGLTSTNTYALPGSYLVRLYALDSTGCTNQVVKNVIIGNPYPSFEYGKEFCGADLVSISHNLNTYVSYHWDFGDGGNSSDQFPQHMYEEAGTYYVTLKATSSDGCEEEFVLPLPIAINNPSSYFSADKLAGCDILEVQFSNQSSNANAWFWNFGNGATSTVANPRVTYDELGTYNVSLISFYKGCSDTLIVNNMITVSSLLAQFSLIQDNQCLPAKVTFTDESEGATTWLWDFGDGTTSTEQNPIHSFGTHPTMPVKLVVGNDYGCFETANETLAFNKAEYGAKNNIGCLPLLVGFTDITKNKVISWQWDFGDGSTSTQQNPDHVYNNEGQYDVTLIVESVRNCFDTLLIADAVQVEYLESKFDYSIPDSSCTPVVVSFTNNSIGGSKYSWDFGDGSSSTNKDPLHIYSQVGDFDVTLTVENSVGCTDVYTKENLVSTQGPQTHFTISDSVACHPQNIVFTDLSVSATKWQWLFGDGSTSDEKSPSHEYSVPGKYAISLLATDSAGCQELKTFDELIINTQPTTVFELNKTEDCFPGGFELTNNSTSLLNPTFDWNFGDGRSSSEQFPELSYASPGTYNVSLTIQNEGGCSDSVMYHQPIFLRDTFSIREPEVTQISVVTDNINVITWNVYSRNNFIKYEVYRRSEKYNNRLKSGPLSEFELLGTVTDPLALGFQDSEADNLGHRYEYVIQAHTYCNDPDSLQNLTVFSPIRLVTESLEDNIDIVWTEFEGLPFDKYTVLRKAPNGSWSTIAEFAPNSILHMDSTQLCPDFYSYKLLASTNEGQICSQSNLSSSKPLKNYYSEQKANMIAATVDNNEAIITEWNPPTMGLVEVSGYAILRSTNGAEYTQIATTPKESLSYMDTDVDVNENQYNYQVRVLNNCDVDSQISDPGQSVLLQQQSFGFINDLQWSPYTGWEEGVGKYLIQRKNEFGEWETIQVVSADSTQVIINLDKKKN